MNAHTIFDQIKSGALADPSTTQGAILYAIVFTFFAWFIGRALRLAVQRVLASDKHGHVDRMAVKFLAQLVRFGVYIFAFISYAHLVPALSSLGKAWLAKHARQPDCWNLPVALSAIQAWRPVAGDSADRTGNRHSGKPRSRLHPAEDG